MKYIDLEICPMMINVLSTGHVPIHDRISHELIMKKNVICAIGQNLVDSLSVLCIGGR